MDELTGLSNLAADLERLQKHTLAMAELLRKAVAEAPPPVRAEGTDRSGAFVLAVGADGMPESLRVDPDWERKVSPDQVASSIVEASMAARNKQMAAVADAIEQARDRGPGPGGAAQGRTPDRAPGSGPAERVPTDDGPDSPGTRPRSLDSLLDHALNVFTAAEQYTPPPPGGTGHTAGDSRLTVTLSGEGLIACTADPRWVAGKSGLALVGAFHKAVEQARAALAANPADESPGENPVAALHSLFGEAMAVLKDPSSVSREFRE